MPLSICSYGASVAAVTPVAPGTSYTAAYTVQAQATKLGFILDVTEPGVAPSDPLVTVSVQTATAAAADNDSWLDIDSSITINAAGDYAILCGSAILDKIRLKVVATRMDNGGFQITPRYLSDSPVSAA